MGLVQDRQGKPVAGARVFLPSGEPSTTTDAQGGYLLEGVLPDKTFLLVKAEGFRFQGWPGDPGQRAQGGEAHPHTNERTARPHMVAPAGPDLARGVADSGTAAARALVASRAGQRRTTDPRWDCLRIASRIDPARVLELLEKHPFGEPSARTPASGKWSQPKCLPPIPWRPNRSSTRSPDPEDRVWAYVESGRRPCRPSSEIEAQVPRAGHGEAHAPAGAARIDPQKRRSNWGESPERG